MRKLIISITIVALAIMSHGAAVSWKATSVKDINGNNAASASGWSVTCTIFSADGGSVIGSQTVTSAKMSTFSCVIDGTATGTSYLAQLVMTDASGNTITSEKAAFVTDSAAEYGPLNFSNGVGFSTETAKINYGSGWTAAPEPTSGLLLLLGVAGLALKRKHV